MGVAHHGKTGKVLWDTVATDNVLSWTLEVEASVEESSVMSAEAVTATTHFKAYVAGFNDWSATVECDLDDGGNDPTIAVDLVNGTAATLLLYTGTSTENGRKFSGSAFVTGISPSTDKEGIVKVTYTFVGSGALSETGSDL